ncbi:sacsin N-terminal ATP-binding-like domain-containing protein [Achromobacter sp. 2789STDY5608621]|uniref:sacsin N-terminal ATP-binding-like domain-containing protein n=1 Tax=Achromobacter sp. 2789STDY5608621 TaxID=1806496 RepID=UPI0006C19312|nr:hypothetical protein [Achromobacter sp. 2789STDY5608621]CUJ41335.1 Uncharacterised protein [Achromobacter sp. 2789STDY5608621]
MNVIAAIAAQRQKLIDGLDANEGEINLRIFEDFYPDEAHFIYELLQNAEDAGATEVSFELFADSCAFEHNGVRHFNEQDIRAITGIFNSSKKDNPDKIGKFGVGFKSVFVYTDTPVIYSKDYSFKILKLVLPEEVTPKVGLESRTRFEFPFNNEKKSVATSYAEVKSGLEKISETTLLFLNNLRYIRWKVGERKGEVLREEHSDIHVEVLKLVDGEEIVSSHWLRFAESIHDLGQFIEPAHALERQKVALAFELELLNGVKQFEKSLSLARQMKIIPAAQGTVSVFFPAEKETSGLRFHLHAPFVPELSRASIKNSPENLPLFKQLAALTAKSLHSVRDVDLLKGDFLAVLPNKDDLLPDRYDVIRQAVLDEMQQQPLVPKQGGGYAPAARLVQSNAALKALLDVKDMALVTGREDAPDWVIGATQRNSNQDRMLGSLGIQNWDVDDLKSFLEQYLRRPAHNWESCELRQDVLSWIRAKPFSWLQALYALLYKHCEEADDYGDLSDVYFVKLSSGEMSTGRIAYFPSVTPRKNDPLHRVDNRVLTEGSKQALQDSARHFLERLGVREPNEQDEMRLLLQSRYSKPGTAPSDRQYLADFKQMIAFSSKYPQHRHVFAKASIFRIASPEDGWSDAQLVYLDAPYQKTDLRLLYESIAEEGRRWPLSDWYLACGIPLEQIGQFAKEMGCQTEFDKLYDAVNCWNNPNWSYLQKAPGLRWGNSINRDFALSPQGLVLLAAQRVEASILVWNALCQSETARPTVLRACYQLTEKGGPHHSDSQLVCSLREMPWVPQMDGTFVKPSDALVNRLPEGFRYDAGYKWLAALDFGSEEKKKTLESAARVAKREELGFQSEDELVRAHAFLRLPQEEQKRILEASQRHTEPIELPVRPVRNVELRQKRVGEEAKATPGKASVVRERSVQLGVGEAKTEAKLYLADQYTNSYGVMVCQVCQNALPFRLPNGSYYFEAVEVLADSPKRFRETYLALCPNHAAAFLYANAQRSEMQDIVVTAAGSEIEIELGGELMTIYFTEMHLADVKACLATLEEEEC